MDRILTGLTQQGEVRALRWNEGKMGRRRNMEPRRRRDRTAAVVPCHFPNGGRRKLDNKRPKTIGGNMNKHQKREINSSFYLSNNSYDDSR